MIKSAAWECVCVFIDIAAASIHGGFNSVSVFSNIAAVTLKVEVILSDAAMLYSPLENKTYTTASCGMGKK